MRAIDASTGNWFCSCTASFDAPVNSAAGTSDDWLLRLRVTRVMATGKGWSADAK